MIGKPVYAKLSKKYFMSIPAGSFLASNCGHSRTESIFAEVVASSTADKELQWGRIVKVSADQRQCQIFNTRKEYEAAWQ
ncbi:MAG: hypothetical protein WC742_10295 [Gallionellaceae bacterium]|jgi:hypothetical protein